MVIEMSGAEQAAEAVGTRRTTYGCRLIE